MSESETSNFEDDESIIQTRDETDERAGDVAEVDWAEVWAIAGAEPGMALSRTQASLCVQVSDDCPPTSDGPARDYCERAVESGQLQPIGNGQLFVTGGA